MPKQPRLIDADRLLEWIEGAIKELPQNMQSDENKAKYRTLKLIRNLTNAGTFDPTPPVQPDIKPGDKVRATKQPLHGSGIGQVSCIYWDEGGKFADIILDNGGLNSRSLDALEVIPDDPST